MKLSMRFIVAWLIDFLFVNKADSKLSFTSRYNLYPWASYSPKFASTNIVILNPLMSNPRASYPYPFSLNHNGGENSNRITHIRFRENQTWTDSCHYVKMTLYHWVIFLSYPIKKWNWLILNQRANKLKATILEQLGAEHSFRTITNMKIMVKMGLNCHLPWSKNRID